MIKILVADDHAIVRQGLKQIVAQEADLLVGGEAQNAEQVLRLVRKQEWDVIVMDISMPGNNGLELLKQLKHERPRLPVLILSMHPEDQFGVRALKAGADGYLTKESAPEELVGAIRKVSHGGKYVSPALSDQVLMDIAPHRDKPVQERLSDREYQIMQLLASGKTVSQIAKELCLSVKTISTYRARILVKMNVKTTVEHTHYAIQHRLVD